MLLLFVLSTIRTILIIIAIVAIFKFIGKLMRAKRDINEQAKYDAYHNAFEKEKERVNKEEGKIHISKRNGHNIEDVEYKEVEK